MIYLLTLKTSNTCTNILTTIYNAEPLTSKPLFDASSHLYKLALKSFFYVFYFFFLFRQLWQEDPECYGCIPLCANGPRCIW